jgi:hypothetical protein
MEEKTYEIGSLEKMHEVDFEKMNKKILSASSKCNCKCFPSDSGQTSTAVSE